MKRVILKERPLPPAPKLWRAKQQPLLFHLYPDQTGRALARHESAGPTVAGIKELLVTPKHLQLRTRRFLPSNFLIDVSFPRRRLTGHQVHIKRCGPAKTAVTRGEESLVTRRPRSGEMLGGILGGRC